MAIHKHSNSLKPISLNLNSKKSNIMKKILFILSLIWICFNSSAQIPKAINFQGVVYDNNGKVLYSHAVCFRVALMDTTGSTTYYQETRTLTTNPIGAFNFQVHQGVIIGFTGNFDAIPWKSGDVEMKVETDNTGTCSTFANYSFVSFVTVPYAFVTDSITNVNLNGASNGQILSYDSTSGKWIPTTLAAGTIYTGANGITVNGSIIGNNLPDQTVTLTSGSTNVTVTGTYPNFTVDVPPAALVPAGTVVAFAGATVPSGWLLCDGATYPTTGNYAALFSAIGNLWGGSGAVFKVPDMRGEFLRGRVDGSGNDPDSALRTPLGTGTATNVGSLQTDAFQGHRHGFAGDDASDNRTVVPASGQMIANIVYNDFNLYIRNDVTGTGDPRPDPTHGSPRNSSETRPRNVYVNYIIKY
jgi:microcystin-dependent protein